MSGTEPDRQPQGEPGPPAHATAARLARLERLIGLQPGGSHVPAWLRPTVGEQRWPALLAVAVAIALQLATPRSLAIRPWWLMPALEATILVVLLIGNPTRINRESTVLRGWSIALVLAASVATAWSAAQLVYSIVYGRASDRPADLLITGGAIWLTNVIVFALWYWEMDRGGPAARANARRPHPDFLFAQMTADLSPPDWEPSFVDYLYLSFTNATAFSPTDTLPLSRWTKLTMMLQSAISLMTVALVVARAVNVLR